MKKNIKYKLVDQDGYTRRRNSGETYWLDKEEKAATGKGGKLCTEDVIHYYDDPLLSVLFNPIHGNFSNPRLIEIEIDKEVVHDGLKGGCKKARFVREIPLPGITLENKVIFAVTVSLRFYSNNEYKKWATDWISGKDRTKAAARSAEAAARSAEAAARSAEAAARSAEAEAWSAEAEAWSAEAAAWSAEAAARSAEAWSAEAAKLNRFFIRTIKAIVKSE